MNPILKYSGVVALVILAILGAVKYTNVSHTAFGSAAACTDGYTCYTNLETQGNSIVDGTASFVGAITGAAATFSGAIIGGLTTQGGGVTATTSNGSVTLTAAQIAVGLIEHTNTGATTVTLPASSTITALIPTAGQSYRLTYANLGSAIDTLAGGTGTTLMVASSTITTALKTVAPSGSAVLVLTRKSNSDIIAEMIPAQ